MSQPFFDFSNPLPEDAYDRRVVKCMAARCGAPAVFIDPNHHLAGPVCETHQDMFRACRGCDWHHRFPETAMVLGRAHSRGAIKALLDEFAELEGLA